MNHETPDPEHHNDELHGESRWFILFLALLFWLDAVVCQPIAQPMKKFGLILTVTAGVMALTGDWGWCCLLLALACLLFLGALTEKETD